MALAALTFPALSQAAGPSPATGAAQVLLDAVRRALRHRRDGLALVVHLSRLRPAPRPHHCRIARALLQDAAARHEGQVFLLPNADLVLLCQPPAAWPRRTAAATGAAPGPAELARTLARLLRGDGTDARLTSLWTLEESGDLLADYAEARLREGEALAPATRDPPSQPALLDAVADLIVTTDMADLVARQTAIHLLPPARQPAGGQAGPVLLPLFREITFTLTELEARLPGAAGAVSADPFLARHLAGRLDERLLGFLLRESGPAAYAGPRGGRLHLNLTLAGLLSADFARLAARPGTAGFLAVELAFMEACADPDDFLRAADRAGELGCDLLLDDISAATLVLARPEVLAPGLLKLVWQPGMASLPPAEALRLEGAVQRCGPHRIVLTRADTEAALHWGVAHGIARFQGSHVDAMLAASRLLTCPAAKACTLRQCAQRAAATGAAGRLACANLTLLDAGFPP